MKPNDEIIAAPELKQLLAGEPKPIVIDVLPEEYFSAEHLPDAKNACVYNVDFLDLVRQAVPNLERQIVVYGSSAKNLASTVALSKLVDAGWKNVVNFQGGLSEWRAAGYRVEGTHEKKDEPKLVDKTYRVDAEQSLIEWIGRGIGGKHNGTLKLSSGEVAISGGNLASGYFTIDLTSIADSDLADRSMATVLVRHLMSEDFFETKKYPEGKFVIAAAEPIGGASQGRPNYRIRGALTLKGVAREIEFPALIGMQSAGSIAAQANFDIDRTEWNVIYGSGRFFEKLGKHLVHDLVSIQLKIVVE